MGCLGGSFRGWWPSWSCSGQDWQEQGIGGSGRSGHCALGLRECLLQELSLPAPGFLSRTCPCLDRPGSNFYHRLGSGVSLASEGRQAPLPQNLCFSSQFPLQPPEPLSCCYFGLSPTSETRSDPVMGAFFSAFQKKAPTVVLPLQPGK